MVRTTSHHSLFAKLYDYSPLHHPLRQQQTTAPKMSSIASFTARRALVARPALLSRAVPVRRFASPSKVEESNLPKAGKRDPELYVCSFIRWKVSIGMCGADYVYRFFSVSCPVLSCSLDGNTPRLIFPLVIRCVERNCTFTTQLQNYTLNSHHQPKEN